MANDEWTTPKRLFDWLNDQFHFTLDAAATAENALCSKYFTKEDNALTQPWEGSIFCNPPYSLSREFVLHAKEQGVEQKTICLLLPVRSDRIWFQELLHNTPAWRACWITGRIHFGNSSKGAFMYSVLFYRSLVPGVFLPTYVDASIFNDNGKGGARS